MKKTTLALLMISTLSQITFAGETIKCETKVICAKYENGKEIGPARCIDVNNRGDIKKYYIKEKMNSELNVENNQSYSTDFSFKLQNKNQDLLGQSPGSDWNYLVIQAHDIQGSEDKYNLRAGLLFSRSAHPVDERDDKAIDHHLNLKSMIDDQEVSSSKFINIVQDKNKKLVISKDIMVPLAYHEHGTWVRGIKKTVKTLIALPLITFNSLTDTTDEKKCGGEIIEKEDSNKYKRTGTTLMAKTLKITCSSVE